MVRAPLLARKGCMAKLQNCRSHPHGNPWVFCSVLVLTFLEAVRDISVAFSECNLDLSLSTHTSLPTLPRELEQIQVLKETSLGLNKKTCNKNLK